MSVYQAYHSVASILYIYKSKIGQWALGSGGSWIRQFKGEDPEGIPLKTCKCLRRVRELGSGISEADSAVDSNGNEN